MDYIALHFIKYITVEFGNLHCIHANLTCTVDEEIELRNLCENNEPIEEQVCVHKWEIYFMTIKS